MNLGDIILEQNSHWQSLKKEHFIPRSVIKEIKFNSDFVEVITGVRRCGKSVILSLLINDLVEKLAVAPKEILLINFDNPAFLSFYKRTEKLDEIISVAEALTGKKVKYVFFDEVQNIEFWEKWVKAKYDAKVFSKIFITGSNSKLLTGKYVSRLSGRYFSRLIFPFSYREFLTSNKQEFFGDYASNFAIKNKLTNLFEKFLRQGGFPALVKTGNKEVLQSYYQTIVLKDVIDNNEIRDSYNLKQVAYFLISNIARPFSYNGIAKMLGIHENTVKEYIELLREAYLFFDIRKFDYSLQKQNINRRKIYCVDNGLVGEIGFSFSENVGYYLENLVFLELVRTGKEVFYYAEKHECDFLVKEGLTIKRAYQVCYDLNEKNRKREIEGLLEAIRRFDLKSGIIITLNQEEEINIDSKKILIIPAWRWFLEK
jgi:predicted AAA+ superfamily ATPase